MGKLKNKSVLSFPVMFEKTKEVSDADNRFTEVKIWLMHLGENFNKSVFDKEVVDSAMSTLAYIPIVGFIEEDKLGDKNFSDHRYIITKDENGLRRKYLGTAYGVIKSADENNAHYEDRLCDDGEKRTFLVVDGLIWNMFEDSSEIMNRDLIKGQSMELWDDGSSIDGYEDEDGLFHFTKFSFRAACILGEDYEPAMINSTVEVQFTMSDFVRDIQSELNDKFTAYSKIESKEKEQGGIIDMPNTDFAQTVMEQFSDISQIVSNHEMMTNRWGDTYSRFYLQDIQEDEAIIVDRKNGYNHYGVKFTVDGDKPNIDFESAVRKKLRYEDYVEGSVEPDTAFSFGKHIEKIENDAFTKIEEANKNTESIQNDLNEVNTNYTKLEGDYNELKSQYDEINPKYEEYVKAENAQKEAELVARKDAEFAKYDVALADCEEFVALKEKKDDMSVEDIEAQCAILYTRKNLGQTNYSKSTNSELTAGLDNTDFNDGSYVDTKYGKIKINR